MIGTFGFDRADTALHQGIVVGIRRATHRDGDTIRLQKLLVGQAGVLPAPVGMMEQFVGRWRRGSQRHLQRSLDQLRLHVGLHGPTARPPIPAVDRGVRLRPSHPPSD